ncbi:ribose 1,5-bisphosphokinase [Veronia pacifica]|uniref:Ribose 1,5-bisphosphate phosphokinase PhnN n=1 Tax=Veronia pacifica TaxID=1080227 RepID=A0A1C3EII5_9GAMM|nr:ribose 1,5-bisphosphokinase [Veronia pacifica]ODA33033.1 phosphonate metabolism protein/1,5-bisphosphokinase (PRPP-forming) PhnN [Veronia pacifica]
MAGKLFYVLGASGAGKDSLIKAIREGFSESIMVAHRYITRPAEAGSENHVALSEAEFACRVEHELFAMHWQANGHCYGLGIEIDHWISDGMHVMVNGSRAYLEEAQKKYGNKLQVVWVSVAKDVLRQRLLARGRESEEEVEQRLLRAEQYNEVCPEGALRVDNSGSLSKAVTQLVGQLEVMVCRP